jgi:urease accessory protein
MTNTQPFDHSPALQAQASWCAHLQLGFRGGATGTRLCERSHSGPLRVQKALYPEGPQTCHAVIVHPPGGVVGGDQLRIDITAGAGAHALLTTPGAGKWYRANGRLARQSVRIEAGAGAALEWLPQETLFYSDARVELGHEVILAPDARYLGSEILCFGRTASGETFARGTVRQTTSIRRAGRLIWHEQGELDGAGSAMHSPFGLAGHTVCATLIGCGPALDAAQLQALRDETGACGAAGQTGVTQLKQAIVVRHLGTSSETARAVMLCAWRHLRPILLGRAACVPRLWNT